MEKIAIVTGANSGIGKEMVRSLCRRGFRVILACRNAERAQNAILDIAAPELCELLLPVDMGCLSSIRSFCAAFEAKSWRLDLLVCNAGIAISDSTEMSPDGFDAVFAANYLGHFLMCHLLRPQLERAGGRVIMITSFTHRYAPWPHLTLTSAGIRRHQPLGCYPSSKLAQILHASEFQRRWPRISVMSICPGVVASNIWNVLRGPMSLMGACPRRIGEAIVATAIARPRSQEAPYLSSQVIANRLPLGLAESLGLEVFLETQPSNAARDPQLARRLYEDSLRWIEAED